MNLPIEIRRQFQRYGRQGGLARASALSPGERRAIARRAGVRRWIRQRFGTSRFADTGLPGGDLVDSGLDDLIEGRTTVESLLVSLAAPRLRREGVPVTSTLDEPEDGLYALLSESEGDLAHARYLAYLGQISSFADACRLARVESR